MSDVAMLITNKKQQIMKTHTHHASSYPKCRFIIVGSYACFTK